MDPGTKPEEYYRDQTGLHPVFVTPAQIATIEGDIDTVEGDVSDLGGDIADLAGVGHTSETVKGNADAIAAAVPPGVIWPYGGASAPPGFLLCDGSAVSRTTYAALFAVIGETYGAGDSSTTFNVPNGQAVSPTGAGTQDIGGRTKTGPAVGAVREDAMQGHWHEYNYGAAETAAGLVRGAVTVTGGSGAIEDPITDGVNDTPRTGAYTHGPEFGVNFIIKT